MSGMSSGTPNGASISDELRQYWKPENYLKGAYYTKNWDKWCYSAMFLYEEPVISPELRTKLWELGRKHGIAAEYVREKYPDASWESKHVYDPEKKGIVPIWFSFVDLNDLYGQDTIFDVLDFIERHTDDR